MSSYITIAREATRLLSLLLEAAGRATLIAGTVAAILMAMRVRTTAVRHAVWTGVVLVMLLLPVAVAWGPRVRLPLLRPEAWQSEMLTRTVPSRMSPVPRLWPSVASGPATGVAWEAYAAALYCAGLGVLLVRLSIGTLRVKSLLRGAILDNGKLTHAACAAPMTIGWIRPTVILPAGWSRWSEAQLSAILAHEGEHVRRRDPLIQWVAVLNRAIFWFHPLAWWLERELSKLAEESCDAVVISRGHAPRDYAECLLALASAVAGVGKCVNVLGMAASGTGLRQKIKKILTDVYTPPVSRTRLACVVSASAAAAVMFAAGSVARVQLSLPAFNVASIKPNTSGDSGGSNRLGSATYNGRNVTLKRVLALAYGPVQEFVGGPGWIESDRYDIDAKAVGSPTREQLQLMVRTLLADRFKLVVHKETRDLPAYALVRARRDGNLGAFLRRSNADCSPANQRTTRAGVCGFRIGNGSLAGRGATMEQLAAELMLSGRLVVDRTGLTGPFDFDMEWTPKELEANAGLFTALREQLGLTLEAIRAPVEVIVIDRAQRPSVDWASL